MEVFDLVVERKHRHSEAIIRNLTYVRLDEFGFACMTTEEQQP